MRGVSIGLLFLVATTATATSLDVQRWRASPHHAPLVMARRSGATASLRIEFRVGSADDGQHPGLTRVAQQALLEAGRHTSFAQLHETIYAAGAELSVETGVRHSAFVLTAPRAAFGKVAQLLLATCLDSQPSPRNLAAAKARARQDQEPGDATTFAAFVASVVTSQAEYGNPPYGSSDGIVELTWPELQIHLDRYFQPANAVVTATGDFSPSELRQAIGRFKGGRERPALARPPIKAGVFYIRSPLELYLYAYPIAIDGPNGVAAVELLAALVGEASARIFRDRGIAYSVDTLVVQEEWLDALVVVVPRVETPSEQVGNEVQQQIEALTAATVDSATFERNRTYVLSRLEQTALHSAPLLSRVAACGRNARWCSQDLAAQIRALTREEFARITRPWVARSSRIDVTLAPQGPSGLSATGGP